MYDVIIIGAGSIGMATGYYLSKSGQSVALIDQYDPPHTNGSHHGETRLIRHAYGEGENYVPLALRSQQLWEQLATEANMEIFLKTGVLNIGTANSSFLENVIQSAKKYSLDVDILSASEINERWPGYQLAPDYTGCYEKDSGILFSEQAIKAYRQLAEQNGAHIFPNQNIQAIEPTANDVTVQLETKSLKAKQLLITAGHGTQLVTKLIDISLPLTPVRKTFSWFAADESTYHSHVFPAWTFNDEKSMFYGFPSLNQTGIKLGRHDGGHRVAPDESLAPFNTFKDDIDDPLTFVKTHFSTDIEHKEGKVCTYTNTPDGDFIIDRLAKYPNIIVACGFSGHGFKFSSGLGEALTQLITKNETEIDLSPFSLARFADN